ncbi:MAG: hypothetical protein Q4C48_04225 [Lachnospiraceae bacterium]|nr:hypothetical protein [Lachnospiraceae bacterium]
MKRVIIIFIFLFSLLLPGCGKTTNEEPQPTQGGQRPVFSGTVAPSATPTLSAAPNASPTLTPIPDGKLLGWLLVEERRHVDGEDTTEQRTYDENNRLIKVEGYRCNVSGDVSLGGEEYAYDEQGNCVFESITDEYGNKSITTYAYEQGKLVEKQYCWGNGTPYVVEVYQYLEDGSVRCERRDPKDNTLEDYLILWHDEEGNVITERYYPEEGICTLIYEAAYGEHGILWSYEAANLYVLGDTDVTPHYTINSYLYDSDGNLLKKIERGGEFQYDTFYRAEEEYRYENGELVYAASHCNSDGTIISDSQEEWRCVFDENGRLSEKILLKEDGTDSVRRKTYRYDDYGNCIEIVDQQGMRRDRYTYVYEPILEK